MPRRLPAEGQLALGISLPAARSARAELTDAAGKKPGSRARKAAGGPFKAWPALGDPVVALVPIDGPDGRVEASLAGQFMGCDYDAGTGSRTGRVRLAAEQPGLSASLSASLPRQVAGVALGQLRRPG
jgi:hypothetical protein